MKSIMSFFIGQPTFFFKGGLELKKRNLNRIKSAFETPFYIVFSFYRTLIIIFMKVGLSLMSLKSFRPNLYKLTQDSFS